MGVSGVVSAWRVVLAYSGMYGACMVCGACMVRCVVLGVWLLHGEWFLHGAWCLHDLPGVHVLAWSRRPSLDKCSNLCLLFSFLVSRHACLDLRLVSTCMQLKYPWLSNCVHATPGFWLAGSAGVAFSLIYSVQILNDASVSINPG